MSFLVKRDSSGYVNLPTMRPEFQPGIRFEWYYTVPVRATVPQLYHDTPFCLDMPDVLATGYMVGMMELACLHGMTLHVKGEVLEVDGRRVRFRVEAWDDVERICEGTHERVVIDPARFNARLAGKIEKASA